MNELKRTGAITELKVMTAFIELGGSVSSPYGDCENYDFIADVNGKMLRIQCKTARVRYGGASISIDCRHSDTKRAYEQDSIDYFATCYKDKVYLLPAGNERNKSLRLVPINKYAPRTRVQWAEDYEIEKVLRELEEETEN